MSTDDEDWDTADAPTTNSASLLSHDDVEKMKASLSQLNVVAVAGAEVKMSQPAETTSNSNLRYIDHILYVHPNADAAVDHIFTLTGVVRAFLLLLLLLLSTCMLTNQPPETSVWRAPSEPRNSQSLARTGR